MAEEEAETQTEFLQLSSSQCANCLHHFFETFFHKLRHKSAGDTFSEGTPKTRLFEITYHEVEHVIYVLFCHLHYNSPYVT